MAQTAWSDSHELALVGARREDTVTRASERCLPPLRGVLWPSAGLDSLHRSFQACLLPALSAGEVFCRIFCLIPFYDQPIFTRSSFEQI